MSVVISGTDGLSINAVPWLAGMTLAFCNEVAPDGWLECNGDAVSRTTYPALFAAIGTKWGVGDGSTTFNLPDAKGATLRGTGTGVVSARDKVGPAVGEKQEDQMQRITGGLAESANRGVFSGSSGALTSTQQNYYTYDQTIGGSTANIGTIAFNSADSPDARASSTIDGETRSYSIGVLYCIKT